MISRLMTVIGGVIVCVAAVCSPVRGQQAQTVQQQPQPMGVHIAEALICQDILNRQPVGESDVFAKETDKLYCFSRVVGAGGQSQITHNWYYQGSLKASVQLPVRSGNWRTWSSKRIDPAWTGEWMVEILAEDGSPLDSVVFVVR